METRRFMTSFTFILILCQPVPVYLQQVAITAWNHGGVNDRPIIGVLSQEYHVNASAHGNQSFAFIPASYIKFVESGGARALPIHINRNQTYYDDIFKSINGVLIPGGGAPLNDSQYAILGKQILEFATKANDDGTYFPIWATCRGFELLATFLVPNHEIITNCSAYNIPMPLNFTKGAGVSRLFREVPSDVSQYLMNLPVTANFHHKCITPQDVNASGLGDLINVLSTNNDENGVEFVSTFEALNYPFYGVQFHPEKNPYEWTTDTRWSNIPHSPEAVRATQYFANFFASEARKNNQHFESTAREMIELIYNINPIYSGKNGSEFAMIYKFKVG